VLFLASGEHFSPNKNNKNRCHQTICGTQICKNAVAAWAPYTS